MALLGDDSYPYAVPISYVYHDGNMLGNRYNPNDEESLQKEIESGFSRMLMIRFDIEHLTGKEAIELVGMRNARG